MAKRKKPKCKLYVVSPKKGTNTEFSKVLFSHTNKSLARMKVASGYPGLLAKDLKVKRLRAKGIGIISTILRPGIHPVSR